MGNSVDLIIGSEAIKQIEKVTNLLSAADQKILDISANARALSQTLSGITLPSNLAQLNATNAQLTAQMQAQATALANLQAQYNSLSQGRNRNNQQSAEEAVNQRLLNRNARELATTNSALAGAYGRLSAEQTRASRNLQDLVIRGRQAGQTQREYNRELSAAQNQFNQLNQRILSADRAIGRFNRNVGNYPTAIIGGLKDIIGAFGIVGGLSLGADIVKSIFSVTKEIQSLDLALKQVTGTNSELIQSQSFLSRISEAYGVNINDLTKQFTQFYVSAKDKISAKEIENIFESVTKAGSTMGLSVESQQRAFLALNQMMSKGTVTAEELRGQLGEALPGAFGIMAKSMNITEQQLGKMMKDGKVIASEVLPNFAKQLEITYGIESTKRVETLAAAQNRLSNSWIEFVRTLNDSDSGGITKFFSSVMDGVNFLLKGLTDINKSLKSIRSEFVNTATTSQIEYLNSIKNVSEREKLANLTKKDAINQINQMNEALAKANHTYELFNKVSVKNFMPSAQANRREAQKDIDKYNASLGTQKGRLLGAQQVLDEINKKQSENTILTGGSSKKKAAQTKAKRDDLDHLESYIKPVGTIVDEINAEISRLTTEKIIANEEELPAINEQLRLLLQLKKQLNETPSGGTLPDFVVPEAPTEDINKLKTDWKQAFSEIADAAQEAGDIIAEFSQRNFENEYDRLEAQKDISLKFAGDSTEAKAKIEEDYEKKRKDIANRENKAKQRQAIFNIAIDTAQAIAGAVAKSPETFGLPWSAFAAAMGVAQIALVTSQKIPQYFDGTDNHVGGMMLVNDRAGANFQEKVILPNGKEIIPEGRNVLMNAPKGTKVLTHEQQIMEMLNERGISMSKNYQMNNGMTASEMDGIMSKHFAKIQVSQTTYDRNGFSSWIGANGNKTIQNNNRVSRVGFSV